MNNLFEKSDFDLFAQYQGKKQEEAPDGFDQLRCIYDKLGTVLDILNSMGYHTEINRNPLIQGGQATMKYCAYHWSKVYPKDDKHFNECKGKVFIVLGTTQDGINIHIDSNSRKGYDSDSNSNASKIKYDTWLNIQPDEASQLSREELAQKVDAFSQNNWIEFNLFAKEFGVQESINILNNIETEKIKKLLKANRNLILTGAPGTGKTYLAKEIAKSMDAKWQLVQFHPSYDYTDFVEGLRPVKNGDNMGFERKDGVFKLFCKDAIKSSKPCVFIIDEINRGEISKIFGELFFSIDVGYRGIKGRVNTQYQNLIKEDDVFSEGFYIPENVYIIGTMNDIDRSVEAMDFAMRRRFAWKEITAKSRQSMLDDAAAWGESPKPSSEIIDEIKTRMDHLNACIIDQYDSDNLSVKDKIGLTKAYQIGASYFLKYGMYNNFDELWENHIEGLLYEYLRGTANIEVKLARLKKAYNDTVRH